MVLMVEICHGVLTPRVQITQLDVIESVLMVLHYNHVPCGKNKSILYHGVRVELLRLGFCRIKFLSAFTVQLVNETVMFWNDQFLRVPSNIP